MRISFPSAVCLSRYSEPRCVICTSLAPAKSASLLIAIVDGVRSAATEVGLDADGVVATVDGGDERGPTVTAPPAR